MAKEQASSTSSLLVVYCIAVGPAMVSKNCVVHSMESSSSASPRSRYKRPRECRGLIDHRSSQHGCVADGRQETDLCLIIAASSRCCWCWPEVANKYLRVRSTCSFRVVTVRQDVPRWHSHVAAAAAAASTASSVAQSNCLNNLAGPIVG